MCGRHLQIVTFDISNSVIANFVLRDLDLLVQGHTFKMLISLKQ